MKRMTVFFLAVFSTLVRADSFNSRFQETMAPPSDRSVQLDQNLRHLAALANPKAVSTPGFYSPNGSQIPPKVQNAAGSVYLLMVPSSFDILPRSEVERRTNSERDFARKSIFEKFAAYCDRGKFTMKLCPFPHSFVESSGFLASGKGEILWTSAHVLMDVMREGDKLFPNFVKQVSQRRATLPIFIFDNTGRLVLDPISSPVKFGQNLPQDIHFDGGRFSYNSLQDVINVELPIPIGVPIPIAANDIIDKSRSVYAVGYPMKTGIPNATDNLFYDRSPYPNSDGVHEFVTMGSFLQLSGDESFTFPNDQLPQRSVQEPEFRRIYATNADGNYRQSGGPLLTEEGLVIGVFTALKIENVAQQPLLRSTTSLSIRPDAWK